MEIRIPVKWLREISDDIAKNPEASEWSFTSEGGNVLLVKRVRKLSCRWPDDPDPHPIDSIDFLYNPED